MSSPLRILARNIPSTPDPESLFCALYGESEYAFWLDSSLSCDCGRFSIMGDATGPHARVLLADVSTGTLSVQQGLTTLVQQSDVFEFLKNDLRALRIEGNEIPGPFALGWVGYLGYELKAECGGKAIHHSADPDAALIFADRALVIDHEQQHVHLLCLVDESSATAAEAWLSAMEAQLQRIASEAPYGGRELTSLPPLPSLPSLPTAPRLRHDRDAYLSRIAACKRAIEDGESYELCLTNMIEGEGHIPPLLAYRRLRRANPAPFASFLRIGKLSVLSSSPERFLSLSRDGLLETRPIKGTAPRSQQPAQDAAIAAQLLQSEKNRAENLMIVDLSRNDLGRCAEIGSVVVSKLFDVEHYATVHQLVSTVQARLRKELSAIDALRICFPGGSMTGAPKLRSISILDELEGGPRGIYSGALGYFSLCGAMDLSMVIRTLVLRPKTFSIGIGGAIVAQSDPASEFAETLLKAEATLKVLQLSLAQR